MGKASKKKKQRRQGIGQSRAEFEQQRSLSGQERPTPPNKDDMTLIEKSMRQLVEKAKAIQAGEARGIEGWRGAGTPAVPATRARWDDDSLGDRFFSNVSIERAASAPPLASVVIPSADALADPYVAGGGVPALVRAVVYDGIAPGDPALDAAIGVLTKVVVAQTPGDLDSVLMRLGGFALFEGARTVIVGESLNEVLPVLQRHMDSALAGIGVSKPTGLQVAEALIRAVSCDYIFEDPADDALLQRLERDGDSGEPLEAMIADGFLDAEDAVRVGLAALSELAAMCRTNATSILPVTDLEASAGA